MTKPHDECLLGPVISLLHRPWNRIPWLKPSIMRVLNLVLSHTVWSPTPALCTSSCQSTSFTFLMKQLVHRYMVSDHLGAHLQVSSRCLGILGLMYSNEIVCSSDLQPGTNYMVHIISVIGQSQSAPLIGIQKTGNYCSRPHPSWMDGRAEWRGKHKDSSW